MITLKWSHDASKWTDCRKMKKSVFFQKWEVGTFLRPFKKAFLWRPLGRFESSKFYQKCLRHIAVAFLGSVRLRLSNDNFEMITRRFKVNRLQENDKKLIFLDSKMKNGSKFMLKFKFSKIQNHSTLKPSTKKSKSHIKNPKALSGGARISSVSCKKN